jgi:adenine-specific DNA-methyltransferase
MAKCLRLTKPLLKESGFIFISIDDNEQAQLKLLCDEIFGEEHFVANVIWQKKYAAADDHKTIEPMHDYVMVYPKPDQWQRCLLPRSEKMTCTLPRSRVQSKLEGMGG